MQTHICHFEALDTWFFREARPHGSIGNSELGSSFPPPVRTLLGALRTLIGDQWFAQHGGDWREFNREPQHPLRRLIGYGENIGPLRVEGPFLNLDGQRLYPAPANLMCKEENGQPHYFLLDLGQPVHCDLGRVHLSCFPDKVPGLANLAGSKPVEQSWLTEAGLQAVLQGQPPQAGQIIHARQLYTEEARLGIGRDNSRRAVQEGLLYQTRHLRIHSGVSVELHLHGLPDDSLLPRQATLRLGGEGRMAGLRVETATTQRPAATLSPGEKLFLLYALTPGRCANDLPTGIPSGFRPARHQDTDVWEGSIGGHPLRILAVACGRTQREGGWDMAAHQPRAVQSLFPAGTVLYVHNLGTTPPDTRTLAQITEPDGRSLYTLGRMPTHTRFTITQG